MKHRSFISVVFGLLTLVALSFLIMDTFELLPVDGDTIELSDSMDDSEDEEDLFEQDFKLTTERNDLILITPIHFVKDIENLYYSSVYISIPVPPPEFV